MPAKAGIQEYEVRDSLDPGVRRGDEVRGIRRGDEMRGLRRCDESKLGFQVMMKAFRWWWGLLLAFALLALSRVFLPLPFVNEVVIFSIYTMGCSFLLGRVGFISFGQPAYLAVGAYG
ncbi:MAG: hypothetical protein HYY77_20275, partial [Betaproteobacteria bacterium]|nr:hypothetical protein [Betaproteobacteria bacterium]